jgi:hypothetical protein
MYSWIPDRASLVRNDSGKLLVFNLYPAEMFRCKASQKPKQTHSLRSGQALQMSARQMPGAFINSLSDNLFSAKTIKAVIVYHACGLHVGIDNR